MKIQNQLSQKNLEQYIIDIQRELLSKLILSLNTMQTTMERAQSLAQEFLGRLPVNSRQEIISVLKTVCFKYPEVLDVYLKYANEYDQEKANLFYEQAASSARGGDVEKALSYIKGGLYE